VALPPRFDLAVVGAGIVGLATALAGARRGLRVVVIDRDAQANGASIRNFGFVTVSGQESGVMWRRARRSREVWHEVADAAGIAVVQRGAWLAVRRAEAVRVLEAFMATDMAEGCRLLSAAEARRLCPALRTPDLAAVLESSLELRVESRTAIPRLAEWLANVHGVTFQRQTAVRAIEPPQIQTSCGTVLADHIAVCPGDDFGSLYAERFAQYRLRRCKLQMLRLADPGFRLPAALMSDLSVGRYPGFSALPACTALQERLRSEQPRHLAYGVHLIVVQSADGTLVVGDSHDYAETPDAFSRQDIDSLILDELVAVLGVDAPPVLERWIGTYASAGDRPVLIDAPAARVRIATVTSGAGASTGFALGEEIIASLLDAGEPPHRP
jgi:FAD dependent oxidoreductase TIGR03364